MIAEAQEIRQIPASGKPDQLLVSKEDMVIGFIRFVNEERTRQVFGNVVQHEAQLRALFLSADLVVIGQTAPLSTHLHLIERHIRPTQQRRNAGRLPGIFRIAQGNRKIPGPAFCAEGPLPGSKAANPLIRSGNGSIHQQNTELVAAVPAACRHYLIADGVHFRHGIGLLPFRAGIRCQYQQQGNTRQKYQHRQQHSPWKPFFIIRSP